MPSPCAIASQCGSIVIPKLAIALTGLNNPKQLFIPLDERDKCKPLCRTCHAVWTNQRLKGRLPITLQLPDARLVEKKFGHHGRLEIKNAQAIYHLFADNPQHLQIHACSLGTGRRIFRAGFELEKILARLMLATRRRRLLRVWDHEGLVFQLTRISLSYIQFEQCARFNLLKFVGKTETSTPPHLWMRNRKTIIKGRGVKKTGVLKGDMEYEAIERGLAERYPNQRHPGLGLPRINFFDKTFGPALISSGYIRSGDPDISRFVGNEREAPGPIGRSPTPAKHLPTSPRP